MKRSSQHHRNEEEEEEEEEDQHIISSSSSSAVVSAAAKRPRKATADNKSNVDKHREPIDNDDEPLPLQLQKPRKHYFQPSKNQGDLLNYFRTGGKAYIPEDAKVSTFDHLQPHSKKENDAWEQLEKDDKITLINEVVKVIVMRVHSGQSILDAGTINDLIKSKGKKLSHKTVLYYARLPLMRLFGYEIVPCFEPGKKDDETDQLVIKDGQYVVRLCSRAAGGEDDVKAAERLQRHEVDLLARGKTTSKLDRVTDRVAARQGLLMAVLTFIIGSPDMKISEGDLFAYIMKVDRRLPPPSGKGSGAIAAAFGRGGGGVDNDDDGGADEGSDLLRDWVKIIRDEFTSEKYIEAVKVEGSAEAAAQAAAEGSGAPGRARDAYIIGVRGRAVLGVLGMYEYASSLREMDAISGASKIIAPEQTPSKDSVGTLLKLELGDYVKALPASVLEKKAAQAAGIDVQADAELFEEEEEEEENQEKNDGEDEDDKRKTKKKAKGRKRKSQANDEGEGDEEDEE
jgi:hypothetical protein